VADDQKVAQNESLFRSANERIEATALDWGAADNNPISFLCECSDLECVGRVEVPTSVYERVRAEAEQFLVLPGHQRPEEEVAEQTERYVVVRKLGEEGDAAEEEAPRS
jgi:hypothetical protein